MTTASPRNFQTLLQAGITAVREGDTHEALALLQQAQSLAADDSQWAEASCMIGRCYGTLGRYAEAEIVLRDALQRAAGSPGILALGKMQMGVVRWQAAQLDEAKAYLEDAEQSFKRLGDTRSRATALGNLGIVFHALGEYQQAINAERVSLELSESLNNLASVAIQSSNLGECHRDLGDPMRAQDLHQRAITLAELLHAEGLQADSWRNLGMDLAEQGELDAGLEAIERALALSETYHHLDIYLQSLSSLAGLRLQRGEIEQARALAEELLQRSSDVPNRRAEARLVIGRCQLAAGRDSEAVATLEQGLVDAQRSAGKMLVLRLHAALGGIASMSGIADVHRGIARESAQQIAGSLTDKALRDCFLASPLIRDVLG